MHTIRSDYELDVSYEKYGSGPPLVLVHGAFSDHRSNWEFVLPFFSRHFTVYAVARRGRGQTGRTEGRSLESECRDVAAVIGAVGDPVFLLGHSYGAHVALGAASLVPVNVRKLVLYEPPWPAILPGRVPDPLLQYAKAGDWDSFSFWFFRDVLSVPAGELEALRQTELWPPIVQDAGASLEDLRALAGYDFRCERFAGLRMPVLLQTGTESPQHLWATNRLAEVLPNARIQALEGQSHEAMTTAPPMYAERTMAFLLDTAVAAA